ncbi:MAG: glycine cleavage system aminomethyltransferase GcvT, partial [Acidimicrobiia bacterium]|nr:glycine cleavage system aminomethyltransferase GcvT [Acidimicrobiia bacterium]
GGRLVGFAGWELPVQYEGVIAEHTWCRTSAALFDVSHMGVVELRPGTGAGGTDGVAAVAQALETLTPAAVTSLEPGRQRYALLTTDEGGIIDDLMLTNRGDHLVAVVNASRRAVDLAHLRQRLTPAGVVVVERTDLALLALQGPRAVDALARLVPAAAGLVFMDHVVVGGATLPDGIATGPLGVARSGYTGEDGFELTVAAERAEALARALLAQPEVRPAGLGARDTLRLEAGLPLYGHDLDLATSPVEADLAWSIPKRRREDGRFPGAARVRAELAAGPARRRVGLAVEGRRPVRDGAALRTADGAPAGTVTSGGYGPTVEAPVAMGYVPTPLAADGQSLIADVRGTDVPVRVAPLPFTPHRYVRGAK